MVKDTREAGGLVMSELLPHQQELLNTYIRTCEEVGFGTVSVEVVHGQVRFIRLEVSSDVREAK